MYDYIIMLVALVHGLRTGWVPVAKCSEPTIPPVFTGCNFTRSRFVCLRKVDSRDCFLIVTQHVHSLDAVTVLFKPYRL